MDTQRLEWLGGSLAEVGAPRGALHGATSDGAIAFGLTPRELEVLRLLAWRATDREIADSLSISPRTVMHHVSHVLAKLEVVNRRDAGFLAAKHDLV